MEEIPQMSGRTRKRPPRAQAGDEKTAAPPGGGAGELINMGQAIKLLKTSRPTFYRWLRAGKIKGMKVGRQWRFYREDVERFLRGEGPRIDLPADIRPFVEELRRLAKERGAAGWPSEDLGMLQQAASLMALLGIVARADEIHIQAGTGGVALLRYRVEGVLQEAARFDVRLLPAVIEEWKRMAACDVRQKEEGQVGRITVKMSELDGSGNDDSVDLGVCFVPAVLGEALTVRIVERAAVPSILEPLPYSPEVKERISRALQLPWGVIIVAGQTGGSAKITTLYSFLRELNTPDRKVMTAEDPVEYLIEGAVQISVNARAGRTFPRVMLEIVRSYCDVAMISEIRDLETIRLAQEAALGGLLVITTLPTEEAAAALRRMVDMGTDPFMVASATRAVLAQRLVRKVCSDCSIERRPTADLLDFAVEETRKGGLDLDSLTQKFRRAVGCGKCGKTGYRGRSVIAEMLEVTPEIGRALRNNASVDELKAVAVKQGMTTMAADGIRRAASGETTLEEIVRVVGMRRP